ncbi:MAG: glycosyltransferase [Desulfovibrio sp.]|jgi:hypothetical protein|nr:glycosyltransferase [Desulfovibrio sp.]
MRIVMLGGGGLAPFLRRLGHDVLTTGSPDADVPLPNPVTMDALRERMASRSFVPDGLIHVDDGNIPCVDGVEEIPCPSIFYSIDTFCNPWHVPFSHAYDHVCVAQRDFLSMFEEEGVPAVWLPLFCKTATESAAPERWLAGRDVPVAFVGTLAPRNIPGRLPFLKAFRRLHPLLVRQGAYEPVFARARIVLNQTAVGEVNYRCFEAMGCGAALLTDSPLHGIGDLFVLGEEVLPPYGKGDAEGAAATVRQWLASPRRLAEVASAGLAKVARLHTAQVRAVQIEAVLAALLQKGAHGLRLASLPERRRFVRAAYAMIVAEMPEEFEPYRQFFLHLVSKYDCLCAS